MADESRRDSPGRQVQLRTFRDPSEVRTFPHGRLELVQLGGNTVGRATLEPGWQWSTSVKPIAKTDSCQAAHYQYQVSGTLRVRMDDGTEFEGHAGDVSYIPPGHDAWVVGHEPVVLVDFEGMGNYAERKGNG
jgi:hypothetical protein